MERSTERWRKLAERTAPEKRLATIVESYLTPVHRDDPGHGCAVPTLGAEIARESPKTRKAFAAKRPDDDLRLSKFRMFCQGRLQQEDGHC
jgi:TetR/AcrR family transcriptional repressor of nem operon